MRKERENLLCKHLLLYISRTNRGSVSGTFRLHSNLLNKADYDEKRGLLFHQIIPSPVIVYNNLQAFNLENYSIVWHKILPAFCLGTLY